MNLNHKAIREVAARAGTTPYFIRKWLEAGDIADASFESVQAHIRRTSLEKLGTIDRATALFYLNHDAAKLDELMRCGALLPLADGMFHGADLSDPKPHRFAILPARPDYTPVRPKPNAPCYWWKKGEVFDRAFESRVRACPEWRRDGYRSMYIADGFWSENRFTKPVKYWQAAYEAVPPRYAAGNATRIFIYAWADKHKTICNLGIIDDYGVMARAHGVYNRSEAWHEALHRAVLAIGLNVAMAGSRDEEVIRLQQWLNDNR